MKTVLDDELAYLIYATIEEIPYGCVATYGQIANLIGKPKNSRLIGRALKISSYYGEFPCHRVVNHQGRISLGWNEQRELLEKEGVTFKANGYVNLEKHQWKINN